MTTLSRFADPSFVRRARLGATLGVLALAGSACASHSGEPGSAAHTPQRPAATTPSVDTPAVEVKRSGEPVAAKLHRAAMWEVATDPDATVALTLDVDGEVRLWPKLDSDDPHEPLALPVYDPTWMSVAPLPAGGYLVTFIDTAGGTAVARVFRDDQGPRYELLYELPATDPQFEAYALRDGRVLTLGHDHRIRLFDTEGNVLSAIDQVGFVPWQLRVSPRPDGPPSIVAVLAGPTRVQPIMLADDALALSGDPREVALDRGPNRNDLILSPDGTRVAAMRRPKRRGPLFTVELIDLATDRRELLVGSVANEGRPRLHWVDDDRMLAEDGEGAGLWLSLRDAVAWEKTTDREDTEDLSPMPMVRVGLPHSDGQTRSHTVVAAGARVVPDGRTLVVDPLDTDRYVERTSAAVRPYAAALDGDGQRVAWATPGSIVVDEVGTPAAVVTHETSGEMIGTIAFVDDERLVVAGGEVRAQLLRVDDGSVLDSLQSDEVGSVERFDFRREGQGGRLAMTSSKDWEQLYIVAVGPSGLQLQAPIPSVQRVLWPGLRARTNDTRGVLESFGDSKTSPSSVGALVADDAGRHVLIDGSQHPTLRVLGSGETKLSLRGGFVSRAVLDPAGERIAVVQSVRAMPVMTRSQFDSRASQLESVSVYDLSDGRKRWTQPVHGLSDVDWSGNGERLAVAAAEGGVVYEVDSGAIVVERRHLGLTMERKADPAPPGSGSGSDVDTEG